MENLDPGRTAKGSGGPVAPGGLNREVRGSSVPKVSLRAAVAAIAIIAVAIRIDPHAVFIVSVFGIGITLAYVPAYGIDRAIGPLRPASFMIVFLTLECAVGAIAGWIAGRASAH
jgi:hypothetical protein